MSNVTTQSIEKGRIKRVAFLCVFGGRGRHVQS
jgi:hypothetical protein